MHAPTQQMHQVRPVKAEDFEGYYHCLSVVALERKYIGFIEPPPIEGSRDFFTACASGKNIMVVAESAADKKIVGWCDLCPKKQEGYQHCTVLGMGLLPEMRGKGLGTLLMKQGLALAKAQGFERVELEVYGSNLDAIKLYKKMGFVEEGRKVRARKLDGQYDDIVVMATFI